MALAIGLASQARLFRAVAELNARESREKEKEKEKLCRNCSSAKSSFFSRDSCAFSSATARKSLACEAIIGVH